MVLLKKVFISILIFALLFIANSSVFAKERSVLLDDINTKNFNEKIKNIPKSKIKQICSYDYCDYVDVKEIESNLSNYIKKYIAKIGDVETQKMVLVKGIKITKIVLYD